MPPSLPADYQALLANASWIRALAARLVDDPEQADDLAQETCLAALRHRPRTDRPLRGWLATVLRNRARQDGRGEGRRQRREMHAAREEALPSTLDLMGRLSLQQHVVEAVRRLDEPYRTTILLRYFEDLTPSQIARRCDVPVSTVKTRLARALERLRGELDGERGGDRGAWMLAILPLARRSGGPTASTMGAFIVSTPLKFGAVALLVAAGWFATRLVWSGSETIEPVRIVGSDLETDLEANEDLEVARAAGPAQRVPAPEPLAPEPPDAEPVAPAGRDRVRGRVLDTEGAGVVGVPVWWTARYGGAGAPGERDPGGESGGGGRFELEVDPDRGGLLMAGDVRRATLLAGVLDSYRLDAEPLIVVGRALPLAGEVVDGGGAPLAAVSIELELPADFRGRFDGILDYSSETIRPRATDPEGRFDLSEAVWVRDAQLRFRKEGFEPLVLPLPDQSDDALRVVLHRPAAGGLMLEGRVVDSGGLPVEGARVALGAETVQSDPQGLFRFDLEDPQSVNRQFGLETDRLVALKRGHLPAELRAERDLASGEALWPRKVELVLGGQPLAIAGRVLDAGGEPVAGLRVWLKDAQFVGVDASRNLIVLENALGSHDPDQGYWRFALTDSAGGFELDGLTDRDYVLEAMDPATLLRTVSAPVPAGSRGVELMMPAEGILPRVAGRVVDRLGRPVADVSIHPMCDAFRALWGERPVSTRHAEAPGTTTDEEGRFELFDVPRDRVYLRLDGEDAIPLELGRGHEGGLADLGGESLEDLEIVLRMRAHFRLELSDPESVDAFAVLDDAGEALHINVFVGNGRHEMLSAELPDQGSGVLAVSDAARSFVFSQDGQEVGRIPVELVPGEVTTVRF